VHRPASSVLLSAALSQPVLRAPGERQASFPADYADALPPLVSQGFGSSRGELGMRLARANAAP